jgi:hypothetical protein
MITNSLVFSTANSEASASGRVVAQPKFLTTEHRQKRLRHRFREFMYLDGINLLMTPQRVIAFTLSAIAIYVLWQGPERFYYEALGTWIISPSIYVRVLPFPFNGWLLSAIRNFSFLQAILCIVPVAMLSLSFAFALSSIWKQSLVHAFFSFGLAATVFSVYHYLQPFGVNLIPY